MGNYEQLKQSVSDVIKTNGNQEITGSILQNVLLTIISSVGANATFAGIATPTTNPGTPDGPVFYLASRSGTYTNFGGIELQNGLSILMWNGSWSSQQIFSVDNVPTAGSDNLVKSGGAQEELALGAVYDVSAKNPTGGSNNDGKWESLSALLSDANLNTLVPTAVRKGGMSIKFIQSSDNKYVQWRLMNNDWSTTVSDWQGVDDEPTAGSDNLVKSGGVQEELALGTVYDVSAKNPTGGPNNDGKWESLSALLSDANLNTLVPTAVRKGGMSIKFVQSSNNKYVQYRLMSDSFSTTEEDWQGVDDEPLENSQNLINSGAVFPIKKKTDLIKVLSTYFGVTDSNGNACLCIKDGILYIYGLQIGVDLIKKGVKGLSITDKNGNATFILKDGVLTIPELQVGNTDTPINADISKFLHPYNCDGGLFQNILCIGDSLTEGDYGSYPAGTINIHKENYPFYLSKKTGAEVDNKGKSGATTMSYWTDELSKIDTTKDYDAIYLFLGTNNYLFSDGLAQDLSVVAPGTDWRNYDTTTGAGAYCAIISWCIENFSSAKLFVINLPYNNIPPTTTQSANYAIQLIANKFNIPVIDIMNNSPFRTDNGKIYRPVGYDEEVAAQGYSNGNLHFGKLGYYTLASCINYLTTKAINNNQGNYSL